MAIKVKKIERKKMPFLERIYIFYIIAGMARTFKHFIRNLLNTKNIEFLESTVKILSAPKAENENEIKALKNELLNK